MNKLHEAIINNIHSVFNKILFLEKKRTFELNGIKLFPSEIHFIIMVKLEQATNATIMAQKLGITKGAISQTVTRLEKKGIIIKTKDPLNKNEMTISFTKIGTEIAIQLVDFKKNVENNYMDILTLYKDNECEIINSFLINLEKAVKKLE
jgi:DNA-binding MarR family transcriptional regulator